MRGLTAAERGLVVEEAKSWVGTPFINCADVKGPSGGVDCAMLLVRSVVDTGIMAPFDPRPYPPQWHMHHDEERFLKWLQDSLGAAETFFPQAGDVAVFKFGRCFSHGAMVVAPGRVVHAFYKTSCVVPADLTETELALMPGGKPRPVRFFELRVP